VEERSSEAVGSADPALHRLRAAVIDLVLERGCEQTTIAAVLARAEVEQDAFDRHFADLNAAFIDAYLFHTDEFDRRLHASFDAEDNWRDGLRAAAYAAAAFVRERPREVRYGGMALQEAGPEVQAYRANHVNRLVDLVDAGRTELDDPASLNRSVAEGVLGSIFGTMVTAMYEGSAKEPEAFIPELMYIAVRPYLGHEVAREELTMQPLP
jgi:AcrR family transcriptional regulator